MNNFDKTVKILREGGIVIFPTDTAFGIGCRADDEKTVNRLFVLRQRPVSQPASILVSSIAMAQKYWAQIPASVAKLLDKFWPGGLTVILPKSQRILAAEAIDKSGGVGIRVPDHDDLREIITRLGVPILGPSANFHGQATPYEFKDLDPQLVVKVDNVLPGECKIKKVSTVVDARVKPWKIIRQGAVVIPEEFL